MTDAERLDALEKRLAEVPKINSGEPFGWPPGSVRAALTFLLVFCTTVIFGVYKWAPDSLVTLTTAAVMGYFNARTNEPTRPADA